MYCEIYLTWGQVNNLPVVSGTAAVFGLAFAAALAAGCTFSGLSSMTSSSSSSSSSVSQSLLLFRDVESENDDGGADSSLLSVNAAIKWVFFIGQSVGQETWRAVCWIS